MQIGSAKSVPFWLPASHFVAGLFFVVGAALLLPFVAADIAGSRFLEPRVVAVVHLVTLGWLTLSIMGALCQLFPVALGTPIYSVRLAAVTLAAFAPGLAAFVTGLFIDHHAVLMTGAVLFASALLLFIYNASRTLWRAQTRDLTWWALAAAFGFLLATLTFGISLALNLRTSHLGTGRLSALAVHVHVAVAGWVGLVIMAIGRRLLPMFLLSHGSDDRFMRAAVYATMAGAFMLSLFHRTLPRPVFLAAGILLGAGAVFFALQIASYLRTRHRPQLDAGLRLVVSGGLAVLIAALLGGVLLAGGSSMRMTTSYGVALVGGLLLFVAGHYYKILPFLLWNHRFAPFAGKRALPKIADLYDARIANVASAATLGGMTLLFGAALAQQLSLAIAASMLLIAGLTTEAIQLVVLLRVKIT